MGYGEAAEKVQDLYLARQHRDAAEAVPFEFIDRTSLIGPKERVRERLAAYAEAGVTTLSVASYAGSLEERVGALRTLADALDESGLGD
jgi:alkanesulfonate monooxygenase SsuD/methylene tetrahydromethanopterin reductase-like flavin-dependent oxidoreductase (luciferase family)